MIADPAFYIAAVFAVLMMGIAKGGLGGGIGVLGVPLMALTIGPVRAAAILLPLLMAMDAMALRAYWRRWHSLSLKLMVPGALVGTLIGWATFHLFSADALRVMVGAISLGYGVVHFASQMRAGSPDPRPARLMAGSAWGVVAGFTSFGVHAGGPPAYAFLLPQQLDRTTFQATVVAFFFVVNWSKVVPYALLGQLDFSNLATSAVLMPVVPIGIWLGAWLHSRINEVWFFRIIYASLILIGLRLMVEGLS